jgi:hypothetical protein
LPYPHGVLSCVARMLREQLPLHPPAGDGRLQRQGVSR